MADNMHLTETAFRKGHVDEPEQASVKQGVWPPCSSDASEVGVNMVPYLANEKKKIVYQKDLLEKFLH